MSPRRVFIGYDPRQIASYTVCQHSLMKSSKVPLAITPLVLETLPLKRVGLTPFTFSRFLVPWLCDFQGRALFMDVDTMVRGDVGELFDMCDDTHALWVSKNKIRFEWASVMMFNNVACKILSPEYIETANGLHTIDWVSDKLVGSLPGGWNHLVGYDEPNKKAKLVHFTQGVPNYPEMVGTEYSDEWQALQRETMFTLPWQELMGPSVHAQPVMRRLMREQRQKYDPTKFMAAG